MENSEDAVNFNDVEGIEVMRRFFCGLYNDTNHWRDNYHRVQGEREFPTRRDRELGRVKEDVISNLTDIYKKLEQNLCKDVFPYKCYSKDQLFYVQRITRKILEIISHPGRQDFTIFRKWYHW